MAIIFQDNFNRADSTDLGPDWQEIGGDFVIALNQLGLAVYNNPVQAVYVNPLSTADYAVQALCATNANPKRNPGVFARGVFNSSTGRYDCYYATLQADVQTIYLYLYQNGSFTTLASIVDTSIDATGNTAYTIRLEVNGSTLTVFVDGVQKLQVTDTTLTAAGYAGIMAGSARLSLSWDDFVIETLGGTVYTEDLGSSQLILAAVQDIQRYREIMAFAQAQLDGITDRQAFLERLAFLQGQPVVTADLQRFVERLGFDQLQAQQLSDLARYAEQVGYISGAVVAATDVLIGALKENLTLLQTIQASITDIQHYQENANWQQVIQTTEQTVQYYLEHLGSVQQQISALMDFQHYLERHAITAQAATIVADIQHYRETLEAVLVQLIGITEQYAGTISEMLQWVQGSQLNLEDVQHYREAVEAIQQALFSIAEWQQFVEQLQTVAGSALSIADRQQFAARLALAMQTQTSGQDVQHYLDNLALLLIASIAGSDIYYPLQPPKPAYTFLKLLRTVYERQHQHNEFDYYNPRFNYFWFGGGAKLVGILPKYVERSISNSEDGATDFDGSILYTPPRFLLENYSSGNTSRASSIGGIIFRDVRIPKNANIKSAILHFWMEYREYDRLEHFRILIMDGYQHNNFADDPVVERPYLNIETSADITTIPVDEYVEIPITVDVTPLVQELVNTNWQFGGDMGFEMWPPLDDNGNKIFGIIKIWDYDGGYPPRLDITLQ